MRCLPCVRNLLSVGPMGGARVTARDGRAGDGWRGEAVEDDRYADADATDGRTFGAGTAAGRSPSIRSMTNTIAPISEPMDSVSAITGSEKPPWNMKPAIIGAITAPPRPTPIAKPLPKARTCVGNTCA